MSGEPTLTYERQMALDQEAARIIGNLIADWPDAREIDILNALLREFTRRVKEHADA